MRGRRVLSLCTLEFVFVFICAQEVQGGGHGILHGRILWFYCWAKIAGWKYKGKKHWTAQLFLCCLWWLWYIFFTKSNFLTIMLENISKLNLHFSNRNPRVLGFFSIAIEFNWKQQLFSIFLTGNIIPIHWENTNEVIFSRHSDSLEKSQ